ncbi:peptidase S8/S53 domain-containing protein [Catenaria anguillulae PL171]|uniref:Peptidase S8/S53 domain-containing protein n=1 Tax=Catenaria anguillulae PL171 TaxID=765915 RepID=A0A1Y2HRJ3_9FUNG|nr:peptidase S8/S53 domain-containing protein [Catenaria anguillulae PL171]
MKFLGLLSVALLALASTSSAAPASIKADKIPDKYIVLLKSDADQAQFTRALRGEIERENSRENAGVQSNLEREFKISSSFRGYSGTFSKNLVERLKNHPRVAAVEQDGVVHALGQQDTPPSWGLTRVSQRERKIPGPYVYPDNAGSGVQVYVIDTGIFHTHPDFEGRAKQVFKADARWPDTDDNGHGTHCASTVAGAAHGVAKKAELFGVKVLSRSGSGSWSGVVAGIEYVANEARKANRTVVANMSLGGGKNDLINNAVRNATAAGVVFAVAAGNENQNACNVSPASEPSAITVASSTNVDNLSSFSNWGTCVDVIAPGSDITGAWINNGVRTISGTSMASPHVAGGAALLLGANPALTPAEVTEQIIKQATLDAINLANANQKTTPNRLLYVQEEKKPEPTPTPVEPTPTPEPTAEPTPTPVEPTPTQEPTPSPEPTTTATPVEPTTTQEPTSTPTPSPAPAPEQ